MKVAKEFYYYIGPSGAVFVKEAFFFKAQGGLEAEWGKAWKSIQAESIEDARERVRVWSLLETR